MKFFINDNILKLVKLQPVINNRRYYYKNRDLNFSNSQMQENTIPAEEQHKIWMKNSGYLYDRLMVQKLKWPSLTFQWLPYHHETKQSATYRFIYASHSSGQQEIEHLYVGQVQFPNLKDIEDTEPGQVPLPAKMKNLFRFNHQAELNKARYNESNPQFFAGKVDNAPIAIFQMNNPYPVHLLTEAIGEGFALQWKTQGLISGDFNGDLRIWRDVEKASENYHYDDKIGDARWADENVIVAVGDDGYMNFWDLRQKMGIVSNVLTTKEDKKEVYAVAVNPYQKHIILTGGQDQSIKIWDTRALKQNLHKFEDHTDSVVTLDWSPCKQNIFASGSLDHKVKIWDMMRVGFQIPKDLGGTDELLFTHEGHQGAVNDVSWNPYSMLLGSCQEEKNTLQFYEISKYLHQFEYIEDVEYLRDQCFG